MLKWSRKIENWKQDIFMMPIMTYGSCVYTLKHIYAKVTGTKRDDALYGRTDMQSMNPKSNCFTVAQSYNQSVRNYLIKLFIKDGKIKSTSFPPSNGEGREFLDLVEYIKVWIWDERFDKLLNDKLITSREVSLHHASKLGKKIIPFNTKKGKSLWGKVNPKHGEIIIKHKDLTPTYNYIIFSRNILDFCSSIDGIRKTFSIPKKSKIIIHNTYLNSWIPSEKKYVDDSKQIDLKLRKEILEYENERRFR